MITKLVAEVPWHLGPRDRLVLDEGLETQRSLVQAEGWNRLTDYRSHWNLGNVAVPEEQPGASSRYSNRSYTDSQWQNQGLTNPLWPVTRGHVFGQDIFDEDDLQPDDTQDYPQQATGYSTSPNGKRPKNPVNPFDKGTLTNPLFPRLEPARSPLVTPAHSNPGVSNPTNTVVQKKTVGRKGKEGERENTSNRAEGLQTYKLSYNSDLESSGGRKKGEN